MPFAKPQGYMNKRTVYFLLLLGCFSHILYAQTPFDSRTTWRVGVSEFSGINISKENRYLLSSLPLLFLERIVGCQEHVLNNSEIVAYRAKLIELAVKAKEKELSQKLADRDRLFFRLKVTEQDFEAIDNSILGLRSTIEELTALDPLSIDVAENKRIFPVEDKNRRILPVVSLSPVKSLEIHDLDALLFGLIEEVESYLFFEVTLLFASGKEEFRFEGASSRENIDAVVQNIINQVTQPVLGREWAAVAVQASPPEAGIWIDGRFVAMGSATLNFEKTGDHTVEIRAAGYLPKVLDFTLAPREKKVVEITLESANESRVEIVSIPPAAGVYASSEWSGTTPVAYPPSADPIQAILRLQGYNTYYVPNLPQQGETNVIRLLPSTIDRELVVVNSRDIFYGTFGAFIVSLAIPIALFDITNTYTFAFLSELDRPAADIDLDELGRLYTNRQVALNAYIGGFFISGSLLIATLVKMVEYINLVSLSLN